MLESGRTAALYSAYPQARSDDLLQAEEQLQSTVRE